jgi:hypothetical protein
MGGIGGFIDVFCSVKREFQCVAAYPEDWGDANAVLWQPEDSSGN